MRVTLPAESQAVADCRPHPTCTPQSAHQPLAGYAWLGLSPHSEGARTASQHCCHDSILPGEHIWIVKRPSHVVTST